MADEGDILTDLGMDGPAGSNGNGADNGPAAGIVTQYIKDLSVENPNAPACYQWQDQPQIDLQFNIASNPVNDEINEVELKITVDASCESGKIYLIELHYAALVGMRNVPDDQGHMFLYAEAPRLIFPFARRIIADATRDLGFQPLMIDPIDFNGLYMQRLAEKGQEEGMGSVPGSADAN
ncbi:protein-export chaperone SecB [Erythrobacter sp. LQ02-29]|uniref:protein-export chaperone SecB n=1 Tax=unclassified Erythrobacter TaxID=2633097 RepID=UPI001BFBFBFD|nr:MULTISPECIES: protein-export chaperone SecB [unclassified Erythrobacter]MCP9221654.1 protein-export chaperone SecB [Erythrobacter sp. LQ02-29]QWC57087.1 protein-export chaperone SecB [Erythrobacter sp. 3-20A1M]